MHREDGFVARVRSWQRDATRADRGLNDFAFCDETTREWFSDSSRIASEKPTRCPSTRIRVLDGKTKSHATADSSVGSSF